MSAVFYDFAKNLKNFPEVKSSRVSKADYQMMVGFLWFDAQV
jgi:hypothetical protein